MNIAIVTSGYLPVPASLGGAVECLVDQIIRENEKQKKCRLTIFSADEPKARKMARTLAQTEVRFIRTPFYWRAADWLIYQIIRRIRPDSKLMSWRFICRRLHFIRRTAAILQMENFDYVVLENHATLLRVMKKRGNAKKYAGRYTYHVHNEQNRWYGCRQVLLHAHCVGTVSRYIAGSIRAAIPELAADRVRVWRNSVDRERFRSEDVEQKALQKRRVLGIGADERVILFAGRLSPEKGAHILLEAMKEVADTEPRVRLVMAGAYLSGEKKVTSVYEEKLRRAAKELGDRVIFTGYISYEDVPVLYRMSDVAVIPSLVADAAPLSVIEAVTGGVPVIATAVGGIPEYTDPSCAVLLSPPKEAGGGDLSVPLARAIRELLADEVRRKQMEKAALALSGGWTVHAYYEHFLACVGADHV